MPPQYLILSFSSGHSRRYFNNFPDPRVLSPDVLLPSAAAVDVEDGELMYLELQVKKKVK